jgi:hypothetical protein
MVFSRKLDRFLVLRRGLSVKSTKRANFAKNPERYAFFGSFAAFALKGFGFLRKPWG